MGWHAAGARTSGSGLCTPRSPARRCDSPGLQDYEASFLRLVEKVTNGCSVEINETGALPAWTSPPGELPEV
jgi:hypothetical protein